MTGAELREFREKLIDRETGRKWSQVRFAKELDINQGTLARWEANGPPQSGTGKIALDALVARLRFQFLGAPLTKKRNSRGGSARSIRDAGDE